MKKMPVRRLQPDPHFASDAIIPGRGRTQPSQLLNRKLSTTLLLDGADDDILASAVAEGSLGEFILDLAHQKIKKS